MPHTYRREGCCTTSDGERDFDLDRVVLSAEAAAAFRGIADTATHMDRGEAFSPPVEELRAFDLVQRVDIGPEWVLLRTPRGRAWGRRQG